MDKGDSQVVACEEFVLYMVVFFANLGLNAEA